MIAMCVSLARNVQSTTLLAGHMQARVGIAVQLSLSTKRIFRVSPCNNVDASME